MAVDLETTALSYGGLSKTARKSYRRRVKSSKCRGKVGTACRKSMGCKKAKGRSRSYCRKMTNKRRR